MYKLFKTRKRYMICEKIHDPYVLNFLDKSRKSLSVRCLFTRVYVIFRTYDTFIGHVSLSFLLCLQSPRSLTSLRRTPSLLTSGQGFVLTNNPHPSPLHPPVPLRSVYLVVYFSAPLYSPITDLHPMMVHYFDLFN